MIHNRKHQIKISDAALPMSQLSQYPQLHIMMQTKDSVRPSTVLSAQHKRPSSKFWSVRILW